jgi:hypothetical protein
MLLYDAVTSSSLGSFIPSFLLSFLPLFVGLEFELRALLLAKQAFYHLGHASSPFCSAHFLEMRSQELFA